MKIHSLAVALLFLAALSILVFFTIFPLTPERPVTPNPPGKEEEGGHSHDGEPYGHEHGNRDLVIELDPVKITVEGTVFEPEGPVAIGVEVKATRGRNGIAVARTNGKGFYRLKDLPAGRITITASSPRYPATGKTLWLNPAEPHLKGVDLQFSETGEIFGFVRDSSGSPLAGAVLRLESFPQKEIFQTDSDPDGAYSFRHLGRGEYSISAKLQGYAPHLDGAPWTLVLESEKLQYDIELKPSCKISGSVTNPEGNPVQGATVKSGFISSVTDSDGHYELELAPSVIHLIAIAEGFAIATPEAVRLQAGDWQRIDIALYAGGRVHGRVADKEGNPLAGVAVEITRYWFNKLESYHYATATTGQGGTYSISNTAGGFHVLKADPAGKIPAYRQVELEEDRDNEVNFTIASGVTVEGTVLDFAGRPLEGATVSVNFGAPADRTQAATGGDGQFKLSCASDELCTIRANKEGYQTVRLENVRPGEGAVIIRLYQSSSLSGRVVLDGVGQENAKVYIWIESATRWARTTGKNGAFEFADMNPGTYNISAEAEGFGSVQGTVVLQPGQHVAAHTLQLHAKN